MKKDVFLFIGCENFKTIIEKNAYYVDKTAYLKTLFLSSSETIISHFIRPRRFGKTLNLSMIKEFCELNYKNPGDKSYQQKLFINNGRKLAVAGDEYKELRDKIMGEFPVISISFKGVEGNTFASAVSSLLGIISELYLKFNFLTKSEKLEDTLKSKFKDILEFSNLEYSNLYDREKLSKAVSVCEVFIPSLAQMLFREYGRQVIVMIDEYDVPLQKAVVAKEPYYDEMLEIVRKISVSTFKQNPDPWLYKGIITGCLRIAHQSVFTDANNFTTYGMSDVPYTGFFGFTKEETESYFKERFPEIKFTKEGFNRFYEYTKGIPMYINSFYNALSSHETYDEDLIDYIFLNNMDQILVMWIRIWGTLNNYEKSIICAMLKEDHITWSDLEKNLDMAPATLNKYIKTLQDKGIINYYNGKYSLEDLMLETWLNHEKERTGVYPY